MLTKEALKWPHPEPGFLGRRWWQTVAGYPTEKYTDVPNRPGKKNLKRFMLPVSAEPEKSAWRRFVPSSCTR